MLRQLKQENFQQMNTVSEISQWRQERAKLQGKTIGFVPTMGNLHEGHLQLCKQSLSENDITVVSVFVNPTQFNQATDFDLYPRTLMEDQEKLRSIGVDYLFVPDANVMYPDNYEVSIHEDQVSQILEGEFRPGHFQGMMTVVMKLLNLVQPARAYFGEKDYQQLMLVKKMVAALFLPTEIVACPTVRADDGVALSSRNSRLSPAQREHAAIFPRLLQTQLNPEQVTVALEEQGFKVDYVVDKWGRRLAAVWLGDVRLIDNVVLN